MLSLQVGEIEEVEDLLCAAELVSFFNKFFLKEHYRGFTMMLRCSKTHYLFWKASLNK